MLKQILTYEVSLDTALFLFILFIVLFGFLMLVSSIFSLKKDLKRKELQKADREEIREEIPGQKPGNKDVFESVEKDFYIKPSNGLRTLAAALFGVSLLLFLFILDSHSPSQSFPEMNGWLKYSAGFIFLAMIIVFACLWRREYTFIENRNTRTPENIPSRFLRFFICHSRLSGLLSMIFIFAAYDLIVFDITQNGLIITAFLIYAFIFFLLAIVKKKPSQA